MIFHARRQSCRKAQLHPKQKRTPNDRRRAPCLLLASRSTPGTTSLLRPGPEPGRRIPDLARSHGPDANDTGVDGCTQERRQNRSETRRDDDKEMNNFLYVDVIRKVGGGQQATIGRDRLKSASCRSAPLTARAAVLHLHVELGQRVAVEDRRIPHVTLATRLDHVANLGKGKADVSARLSRCKSRFAGPSQSLHGRPNPAEKLSRLQDHCTGRCPDAWLNCGGHF